MTASLKEAMIHTMDNLAGADFKRFKHYLRDQGQIPLRKLEKADTDDTVDVMVKVYNTEAGGVMLDILKKMNHNQLAMTLARDLARGSGQQFSPFPYGASGGVNMNISAHSGGMVNAPAISGCTITGPVNFDFGGSVPQQGRAPNSGYSHGKTGSANGQEFFMKHKWQLELRLGFLAPLLIDLQQCAVLSSLERDEVECQPTGQRKNHALLVMLERKGANAQEKFYEALKRHEPFLVEDLEH